MSKLLVLAWWTLVVVSLGACFSPAFEDGKITCGTDGSCPPGLMCYAGTCHASDPGPQDAPMGDVTLTVTKSGAGTGTVTSVPANISCGASCSGDFAQGTQVTLTAAPTAADASTFTGWGGACSGTSTTCTLTLTADTQVSASFGVQMHTVTVVNGGNGSGSVTSFPAGIDCPGTCTLQVANNGAVTLTGTASSGSTFVGFSGGNCTGTAPCALTVTADVTINASFALNNSVVVTKIGNGTGTVSSVPAGINCGSDCSEAYSPGTMVTLSAAADGNSRFVGWTGDCSGSGTCVITVNAAAGVTAEFALQTYPVDVMVVGNGTVTGAGISCPGDCTETVSSGTTVTLIAAPSTGAIFTGWGGACSGTSTCVVTVTMMTAVTATFVPTMHLLTVSHLGAGNGTTTSTPSGINCGTDCTESYAFGTTVVLTAMPASGSTFTGWSGGCTGTGTCSIPITAATSVFATYELAPVMLTVTKQGNGDGVVTSTPGGINCGPTCGAAFAANSVVSLTPMPATGSTFAGWGGACSGTGACMVTMDATKSVTATFNRITHGVTVSIAQVAGGGNSVASNPNGIACPNDCMEAFDEGTSLRLTANPGVGQMFTGWSGATCSGGQTANPCIVNVTAPVNITAMFGTATYLLMVGKDGNGFGNVTGVTSSGTVINCGADCSETLNHNQTITLTATPANAPASNDSVFVGWTGGGCMGLGPCTVMMTAATTVTATFALRPNRMFTSVTTFNGNLGGLGGADTFCTNLANMAGLGGNRWRAWLSSATEDAIDRFAGASGWVRTDGRPFANTLADLAAGNLLHPPTVDQSGNPIPLNEGVWTGTTVGGIHASGAGSDCVGWTSNVNAGPSVAVGSVAATSAIFQVSGFSSCANNFRLMCFQIDRAAAVVPPTLTNVRRAFMRLWTPGGGIADADNACQAHANAAMLPGTYRALLATIGATAISRFDTSRAPWARVDNILVLPTAAAWGAAATVAFDSGPNVTANGMMWFGNSVNWSGAPNFTTAGTAVSTCNDWTDGSAGATAMRGIAGRTPLSAFWGMTTTACNFTSGTITCLQQ